MSDHIGELPAWANFSCLLSGDRQLHVFAALNMLIFFIQCSTGCEMQYNIWQATTTYGNDWWAAKF